jgi:3-methyladenine DNA glycosylase/8-oxoguanine DNA glycosylase
VTEVRLEVRPPWAFRLSRRVGLDRLARVRGGVLHRLIHLDDEPVVIRVAQLSPDRVLFGAEAESRGAAEAGVARMRLALGVDVDLRPFHERFVDDQLIGASVRRSPALRVAGRPDGFEALLMAICEQLIDYETAAAIQRRIAFRLGRVCPRTGLRDLPSAAAVAAQSPALLESLGLSGGRAIALRRAAHEVASGRIDLDCPGPEGHAAGWRRLRAIPGIGPWTVQTMALTGQGRLDQLPAGDLAYLKLVGRMQTGGNPFARASEQDVAALFEPYAPWAGLAGIHALRSGASGVALRLAA